MHTLIMGVVYSYWRGLWRCLFGGKGMQEPRYVELTISQIPRLFFMPIVYQ
ncbi:MAG: hypothetical protein MJ007_03145 [Paludibacteraceae bacterium]|nr:hypothetical protein [Paludibacteraceae bacterium]